MSVQTALRFIAAVREDPELVRRVQELGAGATIDRLVALGAAAGFGFSAEELRRAYQVDWKMRRAHYSAPKAPDSSE